MRPPFIVVAALGSLLILAAAAPARADLENDLATRWRGAWALTRTEVWSDCTQNFTNNAVRGRLVTGKGDHRFAPGEVVQVEKLGLQRARIDLLVTVDEPLRLSWQDGPFTLYDEARCRVELRIEVPREVVKRGALDDLDRAVAEILARADSPEAARGAGWNRRRGEPLPPGYEATFARYQVWKAAQANVAVGAKADEAIEEAARIADRVRRDPEYLAGFGEGAEKAQGAYFGDCGWLLSSTVYAFCSGAPGGHGHEWREGWDDGQRLIYYVELARRLRGCYVPPPPGP